MDIYIPKTRKFYVRLQPKSKCISYASDGVLLGAVVHDGGAESTTWAKLSSPKVLILQKYGAVRLMAGVNMSFLVEGCICYCLERCWCQSGWPT